MADSPIITGQFVEINLVPASVGERILARIIDYFILYIYVIIVALFVSQGELYVMGNRILTVLFYICVYLPIVMYTPLMEIFNNGQTIGKRLLNIRVVKTDGSTPTMSGYILRWLLYMVDIIFAIGVIVMILNSKGQRLGDLAAGTMVVREKGYSRLRVRLKEFDYLAQGYQPSFPEAAEFTLQQIEVISKTLNTPTKDRNKKMSQLAGKVRPMLSQKQTTMNDRSLLETVVKDFHYYALEESLDV